MDPRDPRFVDRDRRQRARGVEADRGVALDRHAQIGVARPMDDERPGLDHAPRDPTVGVVGERALVGFVREVLRRPLAALVGGVT